MKVVKPSDEESDVPRGVVGGAEISQATTGATNIYMGVFRVPAGARSRPHYHEACESAVYMLSGRLSVKWGDRLEQVGELRGLGVGEDIQSVRWFDDLAVVVTFRQTAGPSPRKRRSKLGSPRVAQRPVVSSRRWSKVEPARGRERRKTGRVMDRAGRKDFPGWPATVKIPPPETRTRSRLPV